MTSAEALVLIRGYANAARIEYTGHAKLRMKERNVSPKDVRRSLANATACLAQAQDRWRTSGPDTDDDVLECVVVLEDGDVVVTVY